MFKTKKWMEIIRLKNGWKSFMSMIYEQGRETIVLAYFSELHGIVWLKFCGY